MKVTGRMSFIEDILWWHTGYCLVMMNFLLLQLVLSSDTNNYITGRHSSNAPAHAVKFYGTLWRLNENQFIKIQGLMVMFQKSCCIAWKRYWTTYMFYHIMLMVGVVRIGDVAEKWIATIITCNNKFLKLASILCLC